jgi:5-formyltetrahydrofolate cyclo-ligase
MDVPVEEQKRQLRNHFLNARKRLSANDVYAKSRFIFTKLINTTVYKSAETVHCYVSINRQNEVETRNLIQYMLVHGKMVVVPKMGESGLLTHYKIRDLEELHVNSWGVAEPASNNENRIEAAELDLVIVPMVAGDKQKNRLGYGKGFYDRFLNGINAFKTGILFDSQLCGKTLPTDKFDVQLDMLITESAIVE